MGGGEFMGSIDSLAIGIVGSVDLLRHLNFGQPMHSSI
jgi:hypothetical protein